jgi:PAS domain S-box-containing protein
MINAANDGIVVAEQEGDDNILIYANPAFERLTGYSADDILYQDCRFLQGADRQQIGLEAIRAAVKENRPCRQIIRN